MITPCIKICKINSYTERCVGCGRTKKQIAHWTSYTDEVRELIMKGLEHGTELAKSETSTNQLMDNAENGTKR